MIITAALAKEMAKRLNDAAKNCEYEDTPLFFDFEKEYEDIVKSGEKLQQS